MSLSSSLTIEENLFINQEERSLAGNSFLVQLLGQTRNTLIRGNIAHNYKSDYGLIDLGRLSAGSQVHVEGNELHANSRGARLVFIDPQGESTFANNRYSAESWSTHWFVEAWNGVELRDWSALSGEENPSFELPE